MTQKLPKKICYVILESRKFLLLRKFARHRCSFKLLEECSNCITKLNRKYLNSKILNRHFMTMFIESFRKYATMCAVQLLVTLAFSESDSSSCRDFRNSCRNFCASVTAVSHCASKDSIKAQAVSDCLRNSSRAFHKIFLCCSLQSLPCFVKVRQKCLAVLQ